MTTRILVVIASYGVAGDRYLSRLVEEYRSMSFHVDVIVLSNAQKQVPPGVELVVGLPIKNPWSLPFRHKQIFADRLNDYDVFIYSEDDILITERNIRAFLWASDVLAENEIPGFLLFEVGPDGRTNYPQAHGPFHWDVQSLKSIDGNKFAFFTNEHAACYMLTRKQLQRAIHSGGFLVPPHEGKYDMLCSAATDPYTQCDFRKLICISQFSDFSLHHLPNKYVGKLGVSGEEMTKQIETLLKLTLNGKPHPPFQAQTRLMGSRYSKDYYEPVREDVVSLISPKLKNILSLGCAQSATEVRLVERGHRVVAVPMDSVISAGAEDLGVELVNGDFKTARERLAGEQFECFLILGTLHLVPDPVDLLRSFLSILSAGGQVIATMPNTARLSVFVGRICRDKRFLGLGRYKEAGLHLTSKRIASGWFAAAGLKVERSVSVVPASAEMIHRASFGLADSLLASELIVTARRC